MEFTVLPANAVHESPVPPRVRALLAREGFALTPRHEAAFAKYAALLHRWNSACGLMATDAVRDLPAHLADALSLARRLRDAASVSPALPWLDIGSGGGLPAIPLKIMLPELSAVWIERNTRKAGFLRQAAGVLGFDGVEIIHGAFPEAVRGKQFSAYTARAVEKPAEIQKRLAPFVLENGVFLCQSAIYAPLYGPAFHVEPVDDQWKTAGFRRGALHQILRAGP